MTASRIHRRLAEASAVAVLASLLVVGPAAADACASHPVYVRLNGFANGYENLPRYYWGIESMAQVDFLLNAYGEDCLGDPTWAEWSTINGGATSGDDFQGVTNKHVDLPGIGPEHEEQFSQQFISLFGDSGQEPAVESLTVKITDAHNPLDPVEPIEAPVHIVDDDGSLRVGLAAGPTTTIRELDGHFKANPDVQIPVFRAGTDTSTSVTVDYEITATSDDAFTDLSGGSVTIPSGSRDVTIELGINRDDDATDEVLNITLMSASGGATLAENTTTSVSIDDNYFPGSDNDPPLTSFHHPKNGVTYKFGSAKARTIHVYAPGLADEPSGIVDSSVKTALKRTMKSGACKWWTGSDWVNDGCADSNRNDHWLSTKFLYIFNGKRLYEHYLKKNLPPSVGTTTKFYHAYSTATDGAGNPDDQIELGRNKNKFEIKKF